MYLLTAICRLLAGVSLLLIILVQVQASEQSDWFLNAIDAPENIVPADRKNKIIIAVVDDGFNTSHADLKEFFWINPREVPLNKIDDDGNGLVDDVSGWDVADNNASVTPPKNRLKDFYHGTHIAGIVMQIAKRAYGDRASDIIKILPVKSLSDRARQTYLKDGYKGIEYAVNAGADIIIASWGVGYLSEDEARILKLAEDRDVLVVASAGNFPEQREQFPAAYDPVLATAALNRDNHKIEKSNYGQFVDISTPGIEIRSTSVFDDKSYEIREGTSVAAPMAAAAAALLKLQYPEYSWRQVIACLKSSSDPLDVNEYQYTGKLGAGKLNISSALRCELFDEKIRQGKQLVHPQGYLHFNITGNDSVEWRIKPSGVFKGFRFKPLFNVENAWTGQLNFYSNAENENKLIASYPLSGLPESVYIPGNTAIVSMESNGAGQNMAGLIEYRIETINFSKQFCSDTQHLEIEGAIEDGSGDQNYALNSDCKWLITAPEGKVIKFKFTEFDTEARTDLLYFFNGAGTHEKIMGVFSGPGIPPELTTWKNQVLVWFVTDGQNQGKGWKGEFRFVDPTNR